jgi:tetratricopeptide (TPR) repeat protein
VHRLLTPLLRRVYLLFALVVAVYVGLIVWDQSSWHKERLYRKLVYGPPASRASAAFDLVYLDGEQQLLRALKARSSEVRILAINSLWELWARAAGRDAFRDLQTANLAVQHGAFPEALKILDRVTRRYPGFPEGWNRRATLYWQMGRFDDAITDARRVVALNPNHFGAWQGLGLCQVHQGNLEEACLSIREALKILPYHQGLQRFLNRCEKALRELSPAGPVHLDTV